MKNTFFKVGCAIPSLKVGNPEYNAKQIIHICKTNSDISLLVFPELCITGYTCQDLFFQESLIDKALDCLFLIADSTAGIENTIVVGLPIRYHNKLYNCAAFLSKGEVIGLVPKQNIPNYGEFYECRWFASGEGILRERIELHNYPTYIGTDLLFFDEHSEVYVGTDICEDLWTLERPSTRSILNGAHIIVNLSASDEHLGKSKYRRDLVLQQSAQGYCTYLYASAGMDESSTDLVFSGHSMIADGGNLLNEVIYPEPNTVITAVIDVSMNKYNRMHQSTFINRRDNVLYCPINMLPLTGNDDVDPGELRAALRKEKYKVDANPFVPHDEAKRKERCQEILRIQAHGLATRVRNTGIKNLVIGISGGLDSALALLVCYEAKKIVNDIEIYGYTMPNEGNTTSLTYNNAMELMEALDIHIEEILIGESVKNHLADIGHSKDYQGEGDVAYENAQARMRTYILMDIANMKNGLVIGTGDLSELALGWCTYNGDHMSMYAVNSSVPKTLVKYMVSSYAETMADERLKKVLDAIVDTPITPELTPSKQGKIAQKTEEKIGKYDFNDFMLFYYLRYGFMPLKIYVLACIAYPSLSKDEIKAAMKRFYSRFFSQQFKRSCLPDGPKVGSLTLSPRGDYRMSSDVNPSLYLKEIEEI